MFCNKACFILSEVSFHKNKHYKTKQKRGSFNLRDIKKSGDRLFINRHFYSLISATDVVIYLPFVLINCNLSRRLYNCVESTLIKRSNLTVNHLSHMTQLHFVVCITLNFNHLTYNNGRDEHNVNCTGVSSGFTDRDTIDKVCTYIQSSKYLNYVI